MRYLLVLPLAILFLAGCAKTDRELLNGKWAVEEIKANNEVIYSSDKATQDKVVERVLNQQMQSLPPEAQAQMASMKDIFVKQLEMLGKMTLEIKEDGSFVHTAYQGDKPVETKGKIVLDEKKKEITMKDENDEKFTYTIKDDKLILSRSEGTEKAELIFKRK